MLAYDYPLIGIFFSMLWFFLFVIWIMTLFHVLGDIFRSQDLGGFAKALWLLFVVITPILGVLVYVVARGETMATHAMEDAQRRDAAFQSYVKEAAGTGGPADELAKLAALRDSGHITPAEFESGKAKILA